MRQLEGARESAYLRQVNLLKTPRFGKNFGCHVRTVPGNTCVKFEVCSFNRFAAISI